MKSRIRITKNTISLIIREALNKGALFVLFILIGRLMGKESLGRFSLALVISQIFYFGTELGLNTLIIREVAKDRLLSGKYLINIGVLRVISGFFTMCLICAAAAVIGARGEAAVVIYLCGLSYLFVNIINLYTSIFRAHEKMELELLVSFLKNALFLPSAIWAIYNNMGLVAVFNIFLVSNLLALAAAHFIFIKKMGYPSDLKLDFGFWKNQLIQTSPLWLSQLFGVAYLKIAPLLLFRLRGEEAVGLYNAGFVVVDGFWIMAGCFVYSVFPVLSRLTDKREIRKEYLARAKTMILVFLVLGAAVFLFANGLIPLFYGQKFSEIVPLVRVLLVAALLVALDTYNSMTIIAIGRQFFLPFINAAGLAANFIFNIFFIPRFNYTGSAYALIASESLVIVCMGTLLFKSLFYNRAAAEVRR